VRHVAVIGGGVAGLTVAFRRSELAERVSVFEASERLGGQLHTEHADGFLIEHGAEGFVAGSAALAQLAGALGIAAELREQLVKDSCHFDGTRLTRLAPGEAGKLLGFQVGARALGRGIQSFQHQCCGHRRGLGRTHVDRDADQHHDQHRGELVVQILLEERRGERCGDDCREHDAEHDPVAGVVEQLDECVSIDAIGGIDGA